MVTFDRVVSGEAPAGPLAMNDHKHSTRYAELGGIRQNIVTTAQKPMEIAGFNSVDSAQRKYKIQCQLVRYLNNYP